MGNYGVTRTLQRKVDGDAARFMLAYPKFMLTGTRALNTDRAILPRVILDRRFNRQMLDVEASTIAAEMRKMVDCRRRWHAMSRCIPGEMMNVERSLSALLRTKRLLAATTRDGKPNVSIRSRFLQRNKASLVIDGHTSEKSLV